LAQRGSVLSTGEAKKYRHRTHCRFTIPTIGSHGSALIARAISSASAAAGFLGIISLFLPPTECSVTIDVSSRYPGRHFRPATDCRKEFE
jgi:hypothetical protein